VPENTTGRDFFEKMYRTTPDPWSFASSEYEQQRYATILDHVPIGRFHQAFEPGCSIGELTARLASRCGFVTAIDIAEAAIETARRQCGDVGNVDIYQGSLPDDLPQGPFDLVVFSELGYYFTEIELIDLALELVSRIEPGGELLAVHWTGVSPDHLLIGQQVHDVLREHLPMEHLVHETHPFDDCNGFLLDTWRAQTPRGST
jgi:trans-aconitate methyltransferase